MKDVKMTITDVHEGVGHDLRYDAGRKIIWTSQDGSVRVPEEKTKDYFYPGVFFAAGKPYVTWKELCIYKDASGYLCKDIFGREVFCVSEQFPCFDSYDYATENRRYRWFFIADGGKLTRVYYSDGQTNIQVTEDVSVVENTCLEEMKKMDWPK